MKQIEKRLSEEVRKYEHLYNPSSRHYKDYQMANKSWGEIAQNTGLEVNECLKIWKNLRDKYVRCCKKQASRKGDAGGKELPVFYHFLTWLAPHIKHRNTISKYENKTNQHLQSSSSSSDVGAAPPSPDKTSHSRAHSVSPQLCTSPKQEPASPQLCASPTQESLSPQLCTSPTQESVSHQLCTSPKQEPVSPQGCASPKQEPVSPQMCASPKQEPVPLKLCTSPKQEPVSPQLCSSPKQEPVSPELCVSPKQEPVSPELCVSPKREPVSHQLCTSPNQETVSPEQCTSSKPVSSLHPPTSKSPLSREGHKRKRDQDDWLVKQMVQLEQRRLELLKKLVRDTDECSRFGQTAADMLRRVPEQKRPEVILNVYRMLGGCNDQCLSQASEHTNNLAVTVTHLD